MRKHLESVLHEPGGVVDLPVNGNAEQMGAADGTADVRLVLLGVLPSQTHCTPPVVAKTSTVVDPGAAVAAHFISSSQTAPLLNDVSQAHCWSLWPRLKDSASHSEPHGELIMLERSAPPIQSRAGSCLLPRVQFSVLISSRCWSSSRIVAAVIGTWPHTSGQQLSLP